MITAADIDGFAVHGGANGVGLLGIELGSPSPRQVTGLRPAQHGATDDTRYYGPRSLSLTGAVEGSSMAELWGRVDDLKGYLALGTDHVLSFTRDGMDEDWIGFRVDSPVVVQVAAGMVVPRVEWAVTLFCEDPRFYGPQSSATYDPSDSGTGGLIFSLDFPLVFDASGSGSLTVSNDGNIGTPPTFTITGPVVNPYIDNDSTGESIYTTGLDLSAGDTVVIDVGARTCKLGGTTLRPDLIDTSLTTWFDLQPGSNQLRLRGTGMVAAQTELAVTYNPARI